MTAEITKPFCATGHSVLAEQLHRLPDACLSVLPDFTAARVHGRTRSFRVSTRAFDIISHARGGGGGAGDLAVLEE
jgi:hypothetical protein